MTYRYAPAGHDAAALDALNAAIARRMIDDNEGAPLTTRLDGVVVLRACTISPQAGVDDVRAMAAAMDERARVLARPARAVVEARAACRLRHACGSR